MIFLERPNENIFQTVYNGIFKLTPFKKHSKQKYSKKAEPKIFGFLTIEKKEQLKLCLGVNIKSSLIFEQALTHRSYLQVRIKEELDSNERLEFLGDSVLSLIITDYLFENYPDLSEGELTVLRTKYVSKKALLKVAEALNLKDYILLGNSAQKALKDGSDSLLADAVEAIIAAIYIDSGLEKAKYFILNKFVPAIAISLSEKNDNFKSILLQKTQQKYQVFPTYKVIEESGPAHEKEFLIGVYINDELYGTGKGHSKKEAEQFAAQYALEILK